MKYSIEEIYKGTGQFDKIASISFGVNTESKELYGDHISGYFLYTPQERKDIQMKITETPNNKTDGYVKFEVTSKGLSAEKRNLLLKKGILASDIVEIIQFQKAEENQFTKTETRKLDEPIMIEFDSSGMDEDKFLINLNNARLKSGYKLCPFEIDLHNSILLRRFKDQISKEDYEQFFIDPTTGKVKDGIYYFYLKEKFLREEITKEEEKDWEKLINKRSERRVKVLKKELNKSTSKLKQLGLKYSDVLHKIIKISIHFESERLTPNENPIWWDFERFIHIYIRHVSELQIGERFEAKTAFQYELKDIKSLVKTVLREVLDDIQMHFNTNLGKSFKRHGEMSVYFKGDYYAIDIHPTGRLMAFYKRE